MTLSLLVIDDDETVRGTLVDFFEAMGHTARGATTATAGRQLAAEHAPDVILLDLRLPDADGFRTLEALRADDPELAVIVLTGFADVRTAVQAMQHGAADLLEKPIDLEALESAVRRAAERGRLKQEVAVLRARARADAEERAAPTLAPTIEELIDLAARNSEAPVLLLGETGTGKGYVARQIHERSARRAAPFVEINCASLSPPSSRVNCSAMNAAPSPTPGRRSAGCWKSPPTARSSSMRSANCLPRYSRAFSRCSRNTASGGLAVPRCCTAGHA